MPDFTDERDGNVSRVRVYQAGKEPEWLKYWDHYSYDDAVRAASVAVHGCPGVSEDDQGLFWPDRASAEQAYAVARKAVGR